MLEYVNRALASGVEMIQLREKHLGARDLLELARTVVRMADGSSCRVVVNTRVDVSLAAGADGVHLPAGSIAPDTWRSIVPPKFLIGVSCHTVAEVREVRGADFVVFGPVFETPGKGGPVGISLLAEAARACTVPVYALGGINEHNAAECLRAGAAGVAGIGWFQRKEV